MQSRTTSTGERGWCQIGDILGPLQDRYLATLSSTETEAAYFRTGGAYPEAGGLSAR